MRNNFFAVGGLALILALCINFFFHTAYFLTIVLIVLLAVGFINTTQHKHAILRNFPVLGYFRYLFEMIAPEIQQYFIERSTDGKPFSRNERSLVYQRAKNIDSTTPFGTQLNINTSNYEGIKHSIFPAVVNEDLPRVLVGGPDCKQPYAASLLNISAMSFGSLSENAVIALNKGAKKGGFYHNTGEGGLTQFHLQGGDVTWQIGTGYFGCRTADGNFDSEKFAEKTKQPEVKMIDDRHGALPRPFVRCEVNAKIECTPITTRSETLFPND